MPEIAADPPSLSCYHLFFRSGMQESQRLGPDLSLPRARRARACREGELGQPRGRPRGIPNPRRRVPDLVGRPLSPLSDLLDRKPHLLLPLAKQLLAPPLAAVDPAERLGIDLSSLGTVEDCLQVLATILTAAMRGEITPAEGSISQTGWMPGCAQTGAWHDWAQTGARNRCGPAVARIGCLRLLAYSAAPRRCEKPCSWLVMNSSSAARPSSVWRRARRIASAICAGSSTRSLQPPRSRAMLA